MACLPAPLFKQMFAAQSRLLKPSTRVRDCQHRRLLRCDWRAGTPFAAALCFALPHGCAITLTRARSVSGGRFTERAFGVEFGHGAGEGRRWHWRTASSHFEPGRRAAHAFDLLPSLFAEAGVQPLQAGVQSVRLLHVVLGLLLRGNAERDRTRQARSKSQVKTGEETRPWH